MKFVREVASKSVIFKHFWYWLLKHFFLQANTAKSVEILGKTDSLSHFKVPQIS